MTPQRRRLHLIDKHMYPKNYFFAVTKEGIDGRNSLLLETGHRRRKPPTKSQPKEPQSRDRRDPVSEEKDDDSTNADRASEAVDGRPSGNRSSGGDTRSPPKENDDQMEGLAGAMSALKFVPPNIRFGRGGSGAGFSKR